MDGFTTLVSVFLSLSLMRPASFMPASNRHGKHGVLNSIAHCNDDHRRNIFHHLVHSFDSKVPSMDLSLAPSSFQMSLGILGSVDYKVFNSKLATFNIEHSELTSEDDIPAWRIRKASLTVVGEYSYSYSMGSDSGTYTLATNDVRVYLIDHKCQIDLGDITKVFSGSMANWGYQKFFKGSKDDDDKHLKEKVCLIARKVFREVLEKSSCKEKKVTDTPTTRLDSSTSSDLDTATFDSSTSSDLNTPTFDSSTSSDRDTATFPETTSRPRLPKPYRKSTPSKSYYDDEYAANDEPLIIPGYLPYVDPESKSESKSNSASRMSRSTLTFSAFLVFFVGLTSCLL